MGRGASTDSRSQLTADTRSLKPLARAFSAAQSAALGVDVGGDDIWRAGARGGERQDARSRPDIRHALAGEVETIDEGRKGLAADEITGMKHRRPHGEQETRGAGAADALPRQHEVIGEEVDDPPQRAAERAMPRAVPAEPGGTG
jgi:hypothetical protein